MKLAVLLCVVAAAPLAVAGSMNEVLNSTNSNVSFSGNTGFATDDILGVEVVERLGNFSGWVWPVMTIDFPDTVIEATAELTLDARYYQETYTWTDPTTEEEITRLAYDDAGIWLVLHCAEGDIDLGWGDPTWKQTGDAWIAVVKDLSASAGWTAQTLEVRSTDWPSNLPVPNNDYYHFANIAITPEPASLALLAVGALVLRRR